MPTITLYKNVSLIWLISVIFLGSVGCRPDGRHHAEVALNIALNGAPGAMECVEYKTYSYDRATIILAKVSPKDNEMGDRIINGADIYFDSKDAGSDQRRIAREAVDAHIKSLLLTDASPEWFVLPTVRSLGSIFERKSSGYQVRYVLGENRTIWLYVIGPVK